jgi:hypothetical protein
MDKSKGDDDLVIVMICCYIKTPIQNRKATWIGPQDLMCYHQIKHIKTFTSVLWVRTKSRKATHM